MAQDLVPVSATAVTGDRAWIEGTTDLQLLQEQIEEWEREDYAIKTKTLARHESITLAKDFAAFVKAAWPILEPGREMIWNWHIDYICAYLEAVANGTIQRLVINIPPRCMKPVDEETLLLTKSGERKRLADIETGDQVLTHRGRFRRVSAVHIQGELPTLKITTWAGREISAAPDHPFLTPDGWVQAKDLIVGNVLGAPVPESHGGSDRSDDEFAMAGYIIGDGNVTYVSEKKTSIAASVTAADEEVGSDIIDRGIRMGWSVNVYSKTGSKARRYNLSKGARKWIRQVGLAGKTSYTKRVPDFVFEGDARQIGLFLGSYFACDGTASPKNRKPDAHWTVEWTSVSRELLDDIKHLLLRLGIKSRLRKRVHNKNAWVPAGYVFWNLCVSSGDDAQRFRDRVTHVGAKVEKLSRMPHRRMRFDEDIFADAIVAIEEGGVKRCRCLTVEEDSSFTANDIAVHNSLLIGVFWPAWRWTSEPHHQILSFSHNISLSTRDAVKSRRLMNSQWYQDRWGSKFKFTTDANTKAAYENNHNGHRKAFGMSSGYMGDGGDTLLIDDPHDNEGAQSDAERETTLREFNDGVSTRLNSQRDGAIVIIMQRLHNQDVAGTVLDDEEDEWVHLCIPMEYDGVRYESPIGLDDPRKELKELLWPSHIDVKGLNRLKRRLTPYGQAGQLQQRPTPPGGAILKDFWWRVWPKDTPVPDCEYIIQVYDTAYEAKEESDYSARTTWGVFRYNERTRQSGEGRYNAMLLERWRDRVLFPELKAEAKRSYDDWEPDTVLIEAKASGKPLIQELSRIGVPAKQWAVVRRGPKGHEIDKVARAHIASVMLHNGVVWYPEGRKWALEVVEECAQFPKTTHDDLTDTVTMLLIWLRRLGYVELDDDPTEDADAVDLGQHREAAYG